MAMLINSMARAACKLNGFPLGSGGIMRSIRFTSGSGYRKKCRKEEGPRCGPVRIQKTECAKQKAQEKADGKKKKEHPLKHLWVKKECCNDPCEEVLPRFDDIYYSISDKAKRVYRRTWAECPELKIAPRKICCFDKLDLPPIEKRKRKDRPKTACAPYPNVCRDKKSDRCSKTKMPCCRGARDPPKCKVERGPANCKKYCAPYPSFSECKKKKPKPRRPIECRCLTVPMMCEVYAYMRKMRKRC